MLIERLFRPESKLFCMADADPQPPSAVDPAKAVEPTKVAEPAKPAAPVGIDPAQLAAQKAETVRALAERDKLAAEKKALEDQIAAEKTKKLEEEGKYKELADQERQRREEAEQATLRTRQEADQRQIISDLRLALLQEGALDPEIVVMVDKETLKIEGGRSVGVAEAVKAFKALKPHLFGKPCQTPGLGVQTPSPAPADATAKVDDVRNLSGDKYEEAKARALGKWGAGSSTSVGRRRNRFG